MANKPFNVYYGERLLATGAPPPAGYKYLVDNDGVIEYTVFGQVSGFAGFQDDVIVTPIAAADTWTPIANTLLLRVTTPSLVFAANEFTYVGDDTISPTRIFASMSCKKDQATPMTYKITVSINGAPQVDHMTTFVDETGVQYVSTTWFQTLQQGDTIGFLIANISGDHDLILTDGQLSIG
jgi:hypothetical protein